MCRRNPQVIYYDGEDIEHARDLAKEADAVVFVIGYDHDDEGEYVSEAQSEGYTGSMGGDRKILWDFMKMKSVCCRRWALSIRIQRLS